MFCEVKENFLFCRFSLARKEGGILFSIVLSLAEKYPKERFHVSATPSNAFYDNPKES